MLAQNPEISEYVHSFTFKIWGKFLYMASLLALSILFILSLQKKIISKQWAWVPVFLLWGMYVFMGLLDYPTKLFTFRLWTWIAFCLAPLIGLVIYTVGHIGSQLVKGTVPRMAASGGIAVLFLAFFFFTAGDMKFEHNSNEWLYQGGFWSGNEEKMGYSWMKANIPKQSSVFHYANSGPIAGMDMYICHWCEETKNYQRNGFGEDIDSTANWLTSNNYQYVVIDGQTVNTFGVNETTQKLQAMVASPRFSLQYPLRNENRAFFIFSVQ